MRRLLFLFSLAFILYKSSYAQNSYIDLGKIGKTYPIKEENINLFMQKEIAKYLKENKKEIKKEIEKNIKKLSLYNTKFLFCEKNYESPLKNDYYELPADVINPFGRVVYKKGTKIQAFLPASKTLDICFVSGNRATVDNQLRYFSTQYPQCLFLVAGVSVLDLRKRYPNLLLYPSSSYYEKRFGLRCYPTVVRLKGGKIKHIEASYAQFAHRDASLAKKGE